MAAKVTPLSEMLATRKESVGSETRFEWPVDDEKSFLVLDPRLATDEWRDELSDLGRRFQRNEIAPSECSEEIIAMYLDDEDDGLDQSEEYIALFEAFESPLSTARDMLQQAVQSWSEQTDPTQKSSRATRRQSKRR